MPEAGSVCPTDQVTVLDAVVARLRASLSEFADPTTCFVSDTPWPSVEVNDNLFCTVAPMSGQFDGELPIGAGQQGIVESSMVQVTVWSRLMLDRLERADIQFSDDPRGLLSLKKRVLKALAGTQLFDTGGNPLLIEWMRPIRSLHPPAKQHEDDFSSFAIQFESTFDWDLS